MRLAWAVMSALASLKTIFSSEKEKEKKREKCSGATRRKFGKKLHAHMSVP